MEYPLPYGRGSVNNNFRHDEDHNLRALALAQTHGRIHMIPTRDAAQKHAAYPWVIAFLTLLVACVTRAWAGNPDIAESIAPVLRAPESYGGWVLLPALVAIVCAILTRQVIPALFLGILVASYMFQPCLEPASGGADRALDAVRITMDHFVLATIVNLGHVQVIVFTLLIAGMVGVVAASGGTGALVDLIARRASTRGLGQFTAWVAGLVVFFDDYANSMIVGPTMQPICDRLRISRAKLAYIVDSTAAPVASIALVGTWVGAELGYIQDGLTDAATAGLPPFLEGVDAWHTFVNSIPYRFYAVLAIVMVLIVAVTGRDIGPMRKHEERATQAPGPPEVVIATANRGQWLLAALPILTLVGMTGLVLLWPGFSAAREHALSQGASWWAVVRADPKVLFEGSDSYAAILYGALSCLVVAVVLAVASRRLSLQQAVDAMLEGKARVFPAIVVLVLAWGLSDASRALHVGEVVSVWLGEQGFSLRWLPLVVFLCASGVSFATGTSWGTMGILCPMVVRVAAELGAEMPATEALPLFYGSVGSVLAGAIFGDHCSPISDTTVLSAIASGCSLEDHVWTQLPYALLTAVVAMLAGDTLCSKFGYPPWLGLMVGAAMLYVILRLIGKRPSSANI